MIVLGVEEIDKRFDGVHAVQGCSFRVEEGTITGLIGPNGAGKTTIFNIISGLIKPDGGAVVLQGKDVTGKSPHIIYEHGVSRTFQMLRIFPTLSVIENMMVVQGAHGLLDRILHPKRTIKKEEERVKRARKYLKMVGLWDKRTLRAGDLSYGQQKLLDIARCLATGKKIIMLDEPVAGVNPVLRDNIRQLLLKLRKQGQTILLIEHDMRFVMGLCDKIVVLDHGNEIAIGTPKEIQANKKVIGAYLGK